MISCKRTFLCFPRWQIFAGIFVLACFLAAPFAAHAEPHLVSIGKRRLSIDCTGETAGRATIVLMAGGGEPASDWAKVQPEVATFARVCSYDPAGTGESDKTAKPQSLDDLVEDLHALLVAAGENEPYVLVAHSYAGITARRFATRFPQQVKGFVFLDSSHEEQAWRLHEIDPTGPPLNKKLTRMGFIIKAGEKLRWQTDQPLIVLARGQSLPNTGQLTDEQLAQWEKTWDELQHDLATRSPKGIYRQAANSGHFINLDEPELVVQAIRDVSQPSSTNPAPAK